MHSTFADLCEESTEDPKVMWSISYLQIFCTKVMKALDYPIKMTFDLDKSSGKAPI